MHGRRQGRWTWRRLTACLLIYALFMHGVAFAMSSAMAGPRLAADTVDASTFAGFELCRHNSASPDQPAAPDEQGGDTHCVFCLAGPGFVLEPPLASANFVPVVISIAHWPVVAWRLAPVTVDASSRPRGPPTAA
jgi:hypothetical protein